MNANIINIHNMEKTMRPIKPILPLLFLLAALAVRAQKIEELAAYPIEIGYEKTLHLIFPAEIKYFSLGSEDIIAEPVESCPNILRLKAVERDFPGETNLSVVTADTRFHSYSIRYAERPSRSYLRVDGTAPQPHALPVGTDKAMFLIFPGNIIYADYGSTDVEVSKAEGVENILSVRAVQPYTAETNISVVLEGGRFYTFNLDYAANPERFTFVIDKDETQKVAILNEGERSTGQKERIREAIKGRMKLDLGLDKKVAGVEFEIGNIFIDKDVILLRITLTNRTQIAYDIDFMRFYIQDAKIRKKTAVQQIEQKILFTFDMPDAIPAHSEKTFTVALPKFTIPDKKRLIIEIQEKDGGRHFLYKLRSKPLLNAEEVFRTRQEQQTDDKADRILQILNR